MHASALVPQTAALVSGKVLKDRNLTLLSNFILGQEDRWSEAPKFLLSEGRLAKTALLQMCDGSLPNGFEYEDDTKLVFISLLCLLKVYNLDDLDCDVLFKEGGVGGQDYIFYTDFGDLTEKQSAELQAQCEEFCPLNAVDEILSHFGL